MNNLFKGLLFLEGHVADPYLFDDFAPQYGNQRASQRQFGSPFAGGAAAYPHAAATDSAPACSG